MWTAAIKTALFISIGHGIGVLLGYADLRDVAMVALHQIIAVVAFCAFRRGTMPAAPLPESRA